MNYESSTKLTKGRLIKAVDNPEVVSSGSNAAV